MIMMLVLPLILLNSLDEIPREQTQLLELIRSKSPLPKSLVFVYEGGMRWVANRKLVNRPDAMEEDFQGTFLYRNDGPTLDSAALYDRYGGKPGIAGVFRRKGSVLKGRAESSVDLMDAKQKPGPGEIRAGRGSVQGLPVNYAPMDLFMTIQLQGLLSVHFGEFTQDGWEEIDGRNCLRILDISRKDDKSLAIDSARYWVDLDRNAHVVRIEYYKYEKLVAKLTGVELIEVPAGEGPKYWLPVASRYQGFATGDLTSSVPLFERTTRVVGGSVQVNVDLPDYLFDIRRDSALPTSVEAASKAGSLRQQFDAQPPQPPFRTDPISVRKRIDENLAEADRQSKELEASSPGRSSWSSSWALQIGFGVLGIALVGGAIAMKRRAG